MKFVRYVTLAVWLSIALSTCTYVRQTRYTMVGVRPCAETATPPAMCLDLLDQRTLGTVTVQLPAPSRAL